MRCFRAELTRLRFNPKPLRFHTHRTPLQTWVNLAQTSRDSPQTLPNASQTQTHRPQTIWDRPQMIPACSQTIRESVQMMRESPQPFMFSPPRVPDVLKQGSPVPKRDRAGCHRNPAGRANVLVEPVNFPISLFASSLAHWMGEGAVRRVRGSTVPGNMLPATFNFQRPRPPAYPAQQSPWPAQNPKALKTPPPRTSHDPSCSTG